MIFIDHNTNTTHYGQPQGLSRPHYAPRAFDHYDNKTSCNPFPGRVVYRTTYFYTRPPLLFTWIHGSQGGASAL